MPKTAVRHELDPNTLRSAIVARLPYRSQSSGALQLPAIPALVDHYTSLLIALFAGLGHRFSADERADGTGRNTLPLAKAGFRVDAVELAPALAALLRTELDSAGVQAQVFEGDALDPKLPIPLGAYQLVILAEVVASNFRDVQQVRKLFERAASWLAPGGLLLFSAFVAADGYEPDSLAKQASQAFWSCLFTRAELEQARSGQPFERLSDESCYAFERDHLSKQAWPPTGWFERWSRGHDLFQLRAGRPPHELRWLTYRRTHAVAAQHEPSITAVTHVNAPREAVFRAVTDASQASRFFRRRVSLIAETRPLRQTYRWSNTLKGPAARLLRSAVSDWMFTPTEQGTNIYWTLRLEQGHPWLKPVINMAQTALQRWMHASLQTLKQTLDKEHAPDAQA